MCFFIIKNDDDFLGVASAGLFNVEVEKIKDTNEIVQSGLIVASEPPLGIASMVITLAVAAITIAAKMLSFLLMGKMY